MKERIRIFVQKAKHKKYIAVDLLMIAILMSSQLLDGCSKINDLNETEAAENNSQQEVEYTNESSGVYSEYYTAKYPEEI